MHIDYLAKDRKTFTHINEIEFNNNFIQDNSGEKRVYRNGDKTYKSVTSVLSELSKPFIDKWRRNVGNAVADKISAEASHKGTVIHEYCEKYLNNEDFEVGMTFHNRFKRLTPPLQFIDNIVCQEQILHSDILKSAGTVDCVAEYDGKKSVIDFKTSKRKKGWKDITGYIIQCCVYSFMLKEIYDYDTEQMVIIMSVEDEKPEVFTINNDEKPNISAGQFDRTRVKAINTFKDLWQKA